LDLDIEEDFFRKALVEEYLEQLNIVPYPPPLHCYAWRNSQPPKGKQPCPSSKWPSSGCTEESGDVRENLPLRKSR
jgi:hypothetical protein